MANCLRFKNIQESVFRSLEHFGYGAIIEVTNGARSKKRKRQKTDILKFFKRYYRSSSKDVKIEYGLGLIESSINKLKSLNTNFRISVPYLDHIQYREAAISLVNKFYLAPVENSLLENLLISAETTGKSLKTLVKQSKKKYINNIRGAVCENYIADMFEEVMKNQWRRIFTRLKWEQKETNGDIDVLVVCSPQNFRDALYNIKRKFHKVQVTYHNQKL